jgi:hypothetical protein
MTEAVKRSTECAVEVQSQNSILIEAMKSDAGRNPGKPQK